MTRKDKEVFREVKTAIKNGVVYLMDDAVKISYNGKSYIIKDFYEPRDNTINFLVDGEKIEQSKARQIRNNFAQIMKPSRTWVEVTVKDTVNKYFTGDDKAKTVKYKGFQEKVLLFCYRKHFCR